MSPAMDLIGKSFLVTGSTDGIGLHTAKKLAQQGATVLVHGRSDEKAQRAAEAVRTSGSSSAKVHALSADMSSLKQVHQLAKDVKATLEDRSLDVLIQNAGVFMERKQLSEDGFEMTWAVNVVAPFLLQSLLLSQVASRIVNVSSISASGSLDWNSLNQERGFSSHSSYSQSKLAVQMITAELAQLLAGRKPTVNCLDPGTVNTKMLIAGWGRCGMEIKDANDEHYLAMSQEVDGLSGQYFVSSQKRRLARPAQDSEQRKRLWDILEQQCGHHPKI